MPSQDDIAQALMQGAPLQQPAASIDPAAAAQALGGASLPLLTLGVGVNRKLPVKQELSYVA